MSRRGSTARDEKLTKRRAAPVRAASKRGRYLLVVLPLCALTLLGYSNSFHTGFVLDNKGLLLDDPRIRDATPENADLIFQHTYWWPTGEAGLYRPLTTLSYLFNYAILGDRDQPEGYHWVNLLLHITNVLLVYALALRLMRVFWPPVFIAALWAVHPASTESVTNIVGRADLLAALAVLSGFLMYLKSAEATGWSRWAWLAGLAIVTTIGIFSKESAVAILPVIALYEVTWWKERPPHRAAFYGCLATLLPIAAMLYRRSVVLAASPAAEFPFTDNPIAGADWWTGRLTAIKVMARYLWLTVWPARLSVDYSYNQIPLAHGSFEDWLAYITVFAAVAAVILLYRWNRTAFFLAGFAFLNLLPASNLLFPIGTIMADRLLYLPSFGLLGCLVLAIYALAQRPRMAAVPPIVLCIAAAGFAVRTWMRNPDWQTDLTMATAGVSASPNSFKLHESLAVSLFESDPAHANIDQVIAEEEKSVALLDSLPEARSRPEPYRSAGYYYLLKGDQLHDHGSVESAAAAYQRAVRALLRSIAIDQLGRAGYRARGNPAFSNAREGDSGAYVLLSAAYLRSGDPAEALAAATKARDLDPLNLRIYQQLSDVLLRQGRDEEADIASMEGMVITFLQEEKWREAAELSDRILRHNPADFPPGYYLNAMANLHTGNLDMAERSAREAVRIDTGRRNPRTTYVLGLVLSQKHEFGQSAEWLRAYLKAAPNAPDAGTVRKQLAEIEKLARQY
jgi:tetratricopeptide (TPR) repeat protein